MYIPILYTDGFIKAFIYYILDSTNMTALHDIDASHLELFDDLLRVLVNFRLVSPRVCRILLQLTLVYINKARADCRVHCKRVVWH